MLINKYNPPQQLKEQDSKMLTKSTIFPDAKLNGVGNSSLVSIDPQQMDIADGNAYYPNN